MMVFSSVPSVLAELWDTTRGDAERAQAALWLGELGDRAAVLPLAIELTSAREPFRSALVQALERLRGVTVLVDLLTYGDAMDRVRTAEVLSAFDDPRAVHALIAALRDGHLEVRRTAVYALSAHLELARRRVPAEPEPSPAIADALIERLSQDVSARVRSAAARTLREAPGDRVRAALEQAARAERDVHVVIVIERAIQHRIETGEPEEMREAV